MLDTESFRECLDSAMDGLKANLVELHKLALQRTAQEAQDALHTARAAVLQEVSELRLENNRLRERLSAAILASQSSEKLSNLAGPLTCTQLALQVGDTQEDKDRAMLAQGAKLLVNAVVRRVLRGVSAPRLELLDTSAAPAALCLVTAPPQQQSFSPGICALASTPGSEPDNASASRSSAFASAISGSNSEEAARRAEALGFLEGWHARLDLEGDQRGELDFKLDSSHQPAPASSSSSSGELAGEKWTLQSASETAFATASETAIGFLESLGVADTLSSWGFHGEDKKESQRRSSEPAVLGSLSRGRAGDVGSRSQSAGYCEESASALRGELLGDTVNRRRKKGKGKGKGKAADVARQDVLPDVEAISAEVDSGLSGQAGKRVRFSAEVEVHPIRRWQAAAHAVTESRKAAAAAAAASSASSAANKTPQQSSLMDLLAMRPQETIELSDDTPKKPGGAEEDSDELESF